MDSRPSYFRVSAVLPVAIERRDKASLPPPPPLVVGSSLASEARAKLATLGSRQPDQYKDALNSVLDVVETLERQVEMLHRRMVLDFRKLDLQRRSLSVGGNGMSLQDSQEFQPGEFVCVHLLLPIRNGRSLIAVNAEVVSVEEGTVSFQFDEQQSPEDIDLIVAFTFEHQRKERRRELDSTSASK